MRNVKRDRAGWKIVVKCLPWVGGGFCWREGRVTALASFGDLTAAKAQDRLARGRLRAVYTVALYLQNVSKLSVWGVECDADRLPPGQGTLLHNLWIARRSCVVLFSPGSSPGDDVVDEDGPRGLCKSFVCCGFTRGVDPRQMSFLLSLVLNKRRGQGRTVFGAPLSPVLHRRRGS